MKKLSVLSFRLLLLTCILPACSSSDQAKKPAGLIGEKEMTRVIYDLTLSEAALNGEPLAAFNDTLKRLNVLKEHGLTEQRFSSSFRYYSEHPKMLKAVYDSVLIMLEKTKPDLSR